MNKTLLGICLLILSIVAFFMWINPRYAHVKTLTADLADSTSALTQAQQLDSIRSQLVEKENSFSPSDLAKLQTFLPDSMDSVRFIIDVQGIASRHGLAVQDIAIGDSGKANSSSGATTGSSPSQQYSETPLTFSVTTTYENLLTFLRDIEKSLRVMEIKSLSFSVDNTHPNLYKVSISVSAFWFNPQKTSAITSS